MIRAVTLVTAILVAVANGQVYMQQGNALDANPLVGSAGLNTGGMRRAYDVNSANRIVTGNVTGGAWFRGYSPIRDPNSLFLSVPGTSSASGLLSGLPSDNITGFRRDSVSVADVKQGINFQQGSAPYYSLSGTVTNTGAIAAGLNRPGTSQVRSPYMVPRADTRVETSPLASDVAGTSGGFLNVPTRLLRLDTGRPVGGEVNERLLGTSLFTGFREVPELRAEAAVAGRALEGGAIRPLDTRVNALEALDRRVNVPTVDQGGTIVSPLDRVLNTGDPQAAPSAEIPPTPERSGALATPLTPPAGSADVFDRLRLAEGQFRRSVTPQAAQTGGGTLLRPVTPETGAQTTAQRPPQEQLQPQQPSELQPGAQEPGGAEPLRTFVGSAPSLLNEYLASAEKLLKTGEYYKAASVYEMAQIVDPENPLPLVGRSMALLAAGDYVSSATSLYGAIRMFESLANYPIDLQSFIPDVRALDRRRADIEARLERYEDHRLRFLLGYAEFCSGLPERGVANMSRAVEAAPEKFPSLERFLQVLRQRTATAPAGR